MEVEVRLGRPDDFKEVRALFLKLCRLESDEFDPTIDPEFPLTEEGTSFLEKRLSEGACFVALVEGETVGYLAGILEKPKAYRKCGKIGLLESLFVVDEMRERGVGNGLFKSFKEWCASQGAGRIKVEASFSNPRAIEFYRELGFSDYVLSLEMEL